MKYSGREDIRRQVVSAPGTVIDGHLDEKQVAKLYERWDESWPAPLEFRGGEVAIQAEQIVEVGELAMTKKYGRKMGAALFAIAKAHAS